jgi:hypothetical protein
VRAVEAWSAAAALLLIAGCAASRIESGVFHSDKGYQVTLPAEGWRVDPDGQADLTLRRGEPQGGMLTTATCEGAAVSRPAPILARHLLFGLVHRAVVESAPVEVAGRPGVRSVVRGERDGHEVQVAAVVLKDERCVYDFLYVAPVDAFAAGKAEFDAFVQSFRTEAAR